jgi:hypothetical protein
MLCPYIIINIHNNKAVISITMKYPGYNLLDNWNNNCQSLLAQQKRPVVVVHLAAPCPEPPGVWLAAA